MVHTDSIGYVACSADSGPACALFKATVQNGSHMEYSTTWPDLHMFERHVSKNCWHACILALA